MDIPAYLNFCPADSLFFDYPEYDGGRFALSDSAPPAGWRRVVDTDWVNLIPSSPVPPQGWKIHVSATPDSADEVLKKCWEYCVEAGLMFKFLRSSEMLFVRSSKYGDRTASGKFVTIYPPDTDVLRQVLDELGSELAGYVGPTILSDLRWEDGPLYLRFGGFTHQYLRTPTGEMLLAVQRPDGTLVPDERRPGFHVPEWVEVPDFIRDAIDTRNRGRLTDFPYRPTQARHFSNGGGVYRGVDASDRPVLLKEARPFAGLDITGDDAVARLEQERWAIEILSDMPEMPEMIDYRRGHEHYFLVREEVSGTPLNQYAAERNPLHRADATSAEFADYSEWVLGVIAAVEDGVTRMHERDITYRDLHPGNILVRPDGTLAFIDLEAAQPASDNLYQTLGAPGYMAPPSFRGVDVDRFALGILMLDLFIPLAQEIRWGTGRIDDLISAVQRDFPVPDDYPRRVRDFLTPTQEFDDEVEAPASPVFTSVTDVDEQRWKCTADPSGTASDAERELVAGLLASSTPKRHDRLYPGDPAQFASPTGGISFLHGAAGVLWTLAICGHDVPEDHKAWFDSAIDAATWRGFGFADGLSGVALASRALGRAERASALLERAVELSEELEASGRFADGLSGLGLTLLTFAEDASSIWLDAAKRLVPRLADWQPDERDRRWGPGLFGGSTGPALFFLRLFEATGDPEALDSAEKALRQELHMWGVSSESADLPLHVVRAPMIASGGGTALVLDRFLRYRRLPDLERVRDRLRDAYAVPFASEAGLIHGRGGVLLTLSGLGIRSDVAARLTRDVRLHAVLVGDHPVVSGRFALRMACDLGTGSAGVILALAAQRDAVNFPFVSDVEPARHKTENATYTATPEIGELD